MKKFPPWTEEEIAILRSSQDKTLSEICKLLPNRSKRAVGTRCAKLGIKYKYIPKIFPEKAKEFILNNHKNMTSTEIASALGMNRDRVLRQAARLGVKIIPRGCSFRGRANHWTDEEKHKLIVWAGEICIGEIAEKLNRSVYSVIHQAQRLGIRLSHGTFTAAQVAVILGVHPHTVCRYKVVLQQKWGTSDNRYRSRLPYASEKDIQQIAAEILRQSNTYVKTPAKRLREIAEGNFDFVSFLASARRAKSA